MAISTRTMRIVGASLAAVVLIGGAYYLSGPNPFTQPTANAASTDELLKAYAAKDSDNDGLPDWEEALYGTDPNNPHSFSPTLTDGQAVAMGLIKPKFATAAASTTDLSNTTLSSVKTQPGTLTDQFAQQLFKQYLQNRGATQPTPEQIAAYTQQAVNDLLRNDTVPDAYAQKDVHVSGQGVAALKSYAAAAEAAFAAHTVQTSKDELSYFMDYIQQNDLSALTTVKAIATAYGTTAKALIVIPVPQEAAYAQLEIVNGMASMGEVLSDMSAMQTDPLRALVGIAAYTNSQAKLTRGLADMAKVFAAEQVTFTQGDPGYFFYHAALVGQQAAASSTVAH